MAQDLGIDKDTLEQSMMFASEKPGELMRVSMSDQDAKSWFGVVPPDLSLTARSRGPDWIYSYLRAFYRDESTPTGWNNTLYPNVARSCRRGSRRIPADSKQHSQVLSERLSTSSDLER